MPSNDEKGLSSSATSLWSECQNIVHKITISPFYSLRYPMAQYKNKGDFKVTTNQNFISNKCDKLKLDFTYLKGKKGSYFWDNIRQKWPLWLKDTRMNCNLQTTNEKKMRLVLISHDGLLFNSMAIVYLKQYWCC